MPDHANDPALLNHLRQLEETLVRPEVRSSPERVGALLHPQFTEFGSSGRIFDRAAILAEIASETHFALPSIEDLRLQGSGPDWALINYRAVSPAASTLRSSLWVRSGDRWQMLFHQGTRQPSS